MTRPKVHVQISRRERGGHTLIVDGVDMTRKVLAAGLTVHISEEYWLPDLVTFTVAADVLDIDLPDSAIEAFRADGVA